MNISTNKLHLLKNFMAKTEAQTTGEKQQLEVSGLKQELVSTRSTKLDEAPLTAEINLTSQMATPMHYFSRSSSMTSLNSFDVKSIHSEVASEYSQVTSQVTSPSYKHRRGNNMIPCFIKKYLNWCTKGEPKLQYSRCC